MTVKIGSIEYEIDFGGIEGDDIGEISRKKTKITIFQEMAGDMQRLVLCHEIAHAMLWAIDNEAHVELLALQLLEFLRDSDNEEVIKFLRDR